MLVDGKGVVIFMIFIHKVLVLNTYKVYFAELPMKCILCIEYATFHIKLIRV